MTPLTLTFLCSLFGNFLTIKIQQSPTSAESPQNKKTELWSCWIDLFCFGPFSPFGLQLILLPQKLMSVPSPYLGTHGVREVTRDPWDGQADQHVFSRTSQGSPFTPLSLLVCIQSVLSPWVERKPGPEAHRKGTNQSFLPSAAVKFILCEFPASKCKILWHMVTH